MAEQIRVGIADYKMTTAPNELVTIGLGSCVGIALYAPKSRMGALSHIMLPDSRSFRDTSNWPKFADLALPKIANELQRVANEDRLIAKLVGGASMFSFSSGRDTLQIGERNSEAVRHVLRALNITIIAEDLGGNVGRSMYVDLQTFDVRVRLANRDTYIL